MFEKFMKNENCVKILMWILNHSPSDYEAAIISYDSEVFSPEEFITVTIILNELGIVTVDETQSDSLRILINDDSDKIEVTSIEQVRELVKNGNRVTIFGEKIREFNQRYINN